MNDDRFKFRVWDENGKKYRNDFTIDAEGRLRSLWNNMVIVDMPYVIEQCTGLRDKNGKLIFEGDILLADGDPEDDTDTVVWNERAAKFDFGFYSKAYIVRHSQVVGNVHEGIRK